MGATVGSNVGIVVGTADGADVGLAVGVTVGSNVGIAVGTADGADVGLAVGATVGSNVGIAVGTAVGTDVGRLVGEEVGPDVGVEVGAADGAAVVGVDEGTEDGDPLKLGAKLSRSSTKKIPFVLSLDLTSTLIELESPLSLLPTLTNPGGVTSMTEYTPGGTSVNTKAPFELVLVVAMDVPLATTSWTTTPASNSSPMLSLLVSSNTKPLIVRAGSSTKSLPVEFSPAPRATWIELSLKSSLSETDKYPDRSNSTTVYVPAGNAVNP